MNVVQRGGAVIVWYLVWIVYCLFYGIRVAGSEASPGVSPVV